MNDQTPLATATVTLLRVAIFLVSIIALLCSFGALFNIVKWMIGDY